MKFIPSKGDPCICLRKAPKLRYYEYIAVYVDDLCIAADSPSAIIDMFMAQYNLKLKGDGQLSYHQVLVILKSQMELLLANLENTLIS